MSEDEEKKFTPATDPESVPTEVRCYFVRSRNALLVRASFSEMYMDHYLHLMQHEVKLDPERDQFLKDLVAAFTLHLASRPWAEVVAWTLNIQEPQMNVFVTGDSVRENVVGRVFTEDVKPGEKNLFYSQVTKEGQPVRQSNIDFTGADAFATVEHYYAQSEQRPARLFRFSEEDFVMVSAQPDCDMEWFASLNDTVIREVDQTEVLSHLETRKYQYACGCTLERMLPILAPYGDDALDDLFSDGPIAITCPRCAARFVISREELEAFRK